MSSPDFDSPLANDQIRVSSCMWSTAVSYYPHESLGAHFQSEDRIELAFEKRTIYQSKISHHF